MPLHRGLMVFRKKYLMSFQPGQGTVEYAVVFVAFLSLVVALGILTNFLRDGVILDHLFSGASHYLGGSGGVLRDVFLY